MSKKKSKKPSERNRKLMLGINVLDGDCDFSIRDGSPTGPVYTLEEARRAWEAGNVIRSTLPFQKLVALNWDMDALKEEFKDSIRDLVERITPVVDQLDKAIDEMKAENRRDAEKN